MVLNTHLGHGGPGQQKAQGPAQQRRREKLARARATQGVLAPTATAEATATEDVTKKDGPNERVEKGKTYAEKVSASMKINEASRAAVSMATLAPITNRITFPRTTEAFSRPRKLIKSKYISDSMRSLSH